MSSTWSSGVGKFSKKDPDHGKWWRKIKALFSRLWSKKKCCGGVCKQNKKQKKATKVGPKTNKNGYPM